MWPFPGLAGTARPLHDIGGRVYASPVSETLPLVLQVHDLLWSIRVS